MSSEPKTVLLYGDSITWGFDPRGGADMVRYPLAENWVGRVRADLGEGWNVVDNGVCGRTIALDDPIMGEAVNGIRALPSTLMAHMPLDLVVFFLGTNDSKAFYNVNADVIARCLDRMMTLTEQAECGRGDKPPKMLVLVPPAMGEHLSAQIAPLFNSDHSRSALSRLRETYPAIAEAHGADWLDLNGIAGARAIDGIHLDPDALAPVADVVAAAIRGALP